MVFIALNLLECYDGDTARELLRKGEHDVLEWFRALLNRRKELVQMPSYYKMPPTHPSNAQRKKQRLLKQAHDV